MGMARSGVVPGNDSVRGMAGSGVVMSDECGSNDPESKEEQIRITAEIAAEIAAIIVKCTNPNGPRYVESKSDASVRNVMKSKMINSNTVG